MYDSLSMCIQIYIYICIYTYQNRTLLASPILYATNCPGLLRGSRWLPGLWLPVVLLVNLLVDPATTKKIKT